MKTNAFEKFQKAYQEAVETVERALADETQNPPMNGLVRWMMETEANPYGFLQWEWCGALASAEQFAKLVGHLNHALYDNGEVTFCTVNGQPRMVFANPNEENFRERALHPEERKREGQVILMPGGRPPRTVKYEVVALNITPAEFGPLVEAHNASLSK